MKARLASLCVVAFFSCSAAFAQGTTGAPDPAKIALAAKILEETHTLDNITAALDTMVPTLVKGLKEQSPQLSDETLKLISSMLLDEMKNSLPTLLTINARIYASHFTLDELKSVDDFYQTPVGKKTIAETPAIVKEIMPLGMAWGRQAAEAALPRVIEKLRSQGVKI